MMHLPLNKKAMQRVGKYWLNNPLSAWHAYHTNSLPAPAQAFCRQWLFDRDVTNSSHCIKLGLAFHGLSLFIDPWISDIPYAVHVMRLGHLAIIAFFVVGSKGLPLIGRRFMRVAIPAQMVSIAPYVYLLWYFIHASAAISPALLRIWPTFLCLSIFHILVLPTHRPLVPMGVAAGCFCISVVCFYDSPLLWPMSSIAAWVFSVTPLYHWGRTASAVVEALHEFASQEAKLQIEKTRLDAELELARQIQDSLGTPEPMSYGNWTARCFQRKHSQVGGDWVAMRGIGDDLIAIVADAAGKGLQAALVIHAVQAVWAQAIGDPSFDPEAWLRRVNQTLLQLGVGKSHMVTMGILRLQGEQATYWSAGHPPVFIVSRSGVQRLHSRGNPLGIEARLEISPATLTLSANTESMLLGSDGVFERGSLERQRDVSSKRDLLRAMGALALATLTSEDDRTLVWLERTPATASDSQKDTAASLSGAS